jgi:hypothetical protein
VNQLSLFYLAQIVFIIFCQRMPVDENAVVNLLEASLCLGEIVRAELISGRIKSLQMCVGDGIFIYCESPGDMAQSRGRLQET